MNAHTYRISTYVKIFVALLVLLLATVGLSTLHATGAARDLVTLANYAIAGAKAVLIVTFFMHVKISGRLTWVFAAAGFVWLAILITLTMSDYLTR